MRFAMVLLGFFEILQFQVNNKSGEEKRGNFGSLSNYSIQCRLHWFLLIKLGSNAIGGATSVESYTMDKLTSSLNIDRRRFIFMALLLGCDFCPTGIPGLGKEIVRQLLALWPLR